MIGREFLNWRKKVNSMKFRLIYLSDVIIKSAELAKTIYDQLQLSEGAKSFGATLVLERLEEPGKKQEWKLSLKTPTLNGGTVTETRNTLLSMNLKEKLHSVTFPDGLIVIRTIWRLKEEPQPTSSVESGSPRMWIRDCGTPTTTSNNKLGCSEDSTSIITKEESEMSPSMEKKHWTEHRKEQWCEAKP